MHKLTLLICLVCFLHVKSTGQESKAVPVNKAELLSYEDIKPILAIAFPDKDYSNYRVQSFSVSCSSIENGTPITFTESNPCGKFTENQRSLIEKYGKAGMSFIIENITVVELGVPGTPYHPENQVAVSVPNVSITIR